MKQGWEIKKLGEVCEIYQPKTISKKDMLINGEFPVFGANGVIGQYDKYNHEDAQLLVTCRGATCGSVNISLPKSWINGNAMVIKPKNCSLKRDFLEYFFRGGIDISNVITGAAQPQITRKNLSPVQIPIPPLPEQQRIVEILDKAFVAIDKAKQNAEQNLRNAKEVFQSKLQAIFDNGKLKVENGEWEEKKLGEVCTIKPPKKLAKEQLSDNELVTFFPMADLKEFNHYINPVQTKRLKDVYSGYVYFENNDVLLAKITPCFENGKLGIAQNLKNGIGFGSSEYMVFRPDNNITSEYIYYFLSLEFIRQDGKTIMKGAVGHKRIPVEYISSQNVIIPPLTEQQRIVTQLDHLQSETKHLEKIYQQKLANLTELKKSFLQKAFRGEL